jgi:signal transduction histidine kinase
LFTSVRARFLTGILAVAVPALATLAILEDRYVTRLLEVVAISEFNEDVLDGSDRIVDVVARADRQLVTIARLLGDRPPAHRSVTLSPSATLSASQRGELERCLTHGLPQGTVFAELAVVDRDGSTVLRCRAPDCPPGLVLPRAYRNMFTASPSAAEDGNESCALPVTLGPPGHLGNQTIALVTQLSLPSIHGYFLVGVLNPEVLLRPVLEASVSGGRIMFLADRTGRLIAYASSNTNVQLGASIPPQLPFPPAVTRELVAGGSGLVSRGYPSLISYTSLDVDDSGRVPLWVLGEAMPRQLLLVNVADLRRHTALILAATILVSVGLAFPLARQITRPLRRLQKGAEMIAGGDLEHRLTVTTADEVGEVARAFEVMTDSLRSTLRALEEERRTLERRVAERTAELRVQGEELAAANETLRSLDRLKSDFITNVSHELRTPMTMLSGALDLLHSADALGPEQRTELLRIASDGMARLGVLVQKILEYTDVDAGPATWSLEDVEMRWLVAQVAAETERLACERGVQLTFFCEPTVPPVFGSPEKLTTALRNLVTNAVTFTPAGGEVMVRAEESNESEGTVKLTVRDTGPGIDPDCVAQLFERFAQGGSILTSKPHGLGLGLPVTRRIVEHHSGHIHVETKIGRGSTFTILLPAAGVRLAQAA